MLVRTMLCKQYLERLRVCECGRAVKVVFLSHGSQSHVGAQHAMTQSSLQLPLQPLQ